MAELVDAPDSKSGPCFQNIKTGLNNLVQKVRVVDFLLPYKSKRQEEKIS